MKIKKLNTNSVNCLPYQQPIQNDTKSRQIKWWFAYMCDNGLNKYKSKHNPERNKNEKIIINFDNV